METPQNLDLSSITVKVLEVYEHHWVSGQKRHHIPVKHPRAVLLHQLWFLQEGVVEFRANGKMWKVEKGEICFLPVTHKRDIITTQPAAWLSLQLRITIFNRFNPLQNVSLPVKGRLDEPERSQIESWMQYIVRQHCMKAAHYGLVEEGLARAVFGLCWPHLISPLLKTSIKFELPLWLEQTLLRVSTDLTCNVAGLAPEAGFSPAQFRRSFHRLMGSTPRDYIKLQRLEAMRHFLEHTDLPMSAIVERVGLRDASHFAQVFKTVYGMPPSAYRTSLHQGK